MSYSVFRVEGIKNTGALVGLGKHNQERISHTNPDIDKNRSNQNIELIKCEGTYNQKFNEITRNLRKTHEERMQNMRTDRIKTFEKSINDDKTDIACEMLFTSDEEFFKGMNRQDITKWAQTSLEFVTKNIGISSKDIIHATVHMDEKTPHLHVVAVPITKVYDGRRKEEVLKISRAKFIGGKLHLSKLQDAYNELMNINGFNLERGVRGANKEHKSTITYKKEQLAKLDVELVRTSKALSQNLSELKEIKASEHDIDSIPYKATFMDKNNVVLNKHDFEKLKELSRKAIVSSNTVKDLARKYENLSDNFSAVKSNLSKYADKNVKLKKDLAAAQKNINTLMIQRKALTFVVKENNLIDKATEKLKELSKPVEKIIKSKSFDMER